MKRFVPVQNKKRFDVPGYSPAAMEQVSNDLIDSGIKPRLARGLDVHDGPAPPLTDRTAKEKARKGLPTIRDWWKTGRTLRSLKTLEIANNRSVVGFTDQTTNRRAYFNNRRWMQFGVSGSDERVIAESLRRQRPVKVVDGTD